MKDIIHKIRNQIAEDNTKAALQLLRNLMQKDKRLNEVVIHSARINRVEREVRLGVRNFEDTILARNQVNMAILDICNKLADLYSLSNPEKEYLDKLISKYEYLQLDWMNVLLTGHSKEEKPTEDGATSLIKIKLSEIFIPLKLKFDNIAVTQKIANSLGYNIDFSDRDVEALYRLEAVRAVAALENKANSRMSERNMPNCLIILGQPGGGKSTLVDHLTVQLAKKRLVGNFDDERKMPGWEGEQKPLIVRIILRDFAVWLSNYENSHIHINNLVWNYLQTEEEEFFPELREELINNGGIVFFDGLDEVSGSVTNNQRREVTEAIKAFSGSQPKYIIIITCREYVFQDRKQANQIHELLDVQRFPVARLALFQRRDIRAFVRNWYKLLGDYNGWDAQTSTQKARALIAEIDKIPDLKKLAVYPLLLTLMANMHYLDGSLPKHRADFYERTLMLQLIYWENPVQEEELAKSDFLEEYKVPQRTISYVLAEAAFIVHERQGKSIEPEKIGGYISATALEEKLNHSLRDPREEYAELVRYFLERLENKFGPHYQMHFPHIAKAFTQYLEVRAGLLQFQGKNEDGIDTYAFSHRSFQEYLAAEYILNQRNFDEMLKERVLENLPWWREVFLLAAGICAKKRFNDFVALIDSILPESGMEGNKIDHPNRVLLAAQALAENKIDPGVQNRAYTRTLDEVRKSLLDILTFNKDLNSIERTIADGSLAGLGDPREEVLSVDQMKFCYVPPGSFFKSSKNIHQHKQSDLSEDSINKAFWISRFPVSNAHFQQFIDAGGYAEQAFWKENVNWVNGQYDGRSAPEIDDSPFGLPNHPVVGISWFEAMAFTRWLTRKWRKEDILPPGYVVRLPTKREWEKAARGGIKIPHEPLILPVKQIDWEYSWSEVNNAQPHRIYPWGDSEADPNRMNFHGSNIGYTTPLGCYPGGASPYGCEEMSGNVSEWGFGRYDGAMGKGDDFLSIMGGSYSDLADSCTSTHQEKKKWNVTMDSIGFRLVIARS